MEKTEKDFSTSIKMLGYLLKSYNDGVTESYTLVAVELRKLLCESKKNPLLEKILPEIKLHKLRCTELAEKFPGMSPLLPGRLEIKESGEPTFKLGLASSKELIPLKDWISQVIFAEGVTIRDFIKSVADKEGAHSDENYDKNLLLGNSFKYGNIESHKVLIIGIAEYILKFLENPNLLD